MACVCSITRVSLILCARLLKLLWLIFAACCGLSLLLVVGNLLIMGLELLGVCDAAPQGAVVLHAVSVAKDALHDTQWLSVVCMAHEPGNTVHVDTWSGQAAAIGSSTPNCVRTTSSIRSSHIHTRTRIHSLRHTTDITLTSLAVALHTSFTCTHCMTQWRAHNLPAHICTAHTAPA